VQTYRGAEYCNDRACVCVCVCVFVHDHIFGNARPIFTKFCMLVTYGRSSVLLWRRSDTLRISGFVNDVIFAHKLIGCSTSPGCIFMTHVCILQIMSLCIYRQENDVLKVAPQVAALGAESAVCDCFVFT